MAKNPKKKPSKRRKSSPSTQEWEALTSDEVMQRIFGPEAQQSLKQQALGDDDEQPSEQGSI